MGLAALGALITISETVFLLALSRNGSIGSFLYEQAQFSVAYLAFGLVLYGLDKGLLSRLFSGDKLKRARVISWSAYALSIAGSSLFLFNPASYKVTVIGSQVHAAQQLVFWFPLFLVLLVSPLSTIIAILRSENPQLRNYGKWFGLSSSLIFLGTLREATVIPSAGDPFADLLVAFVPFVAGSFCLLMGVRYTLSSKRKERISAVVM